MIKITGKIFEKKIFSISSIVYTIGVSTSISIMLWGLSKSTTVAMFSFVMFFLLNVVINLKSNDIKKIYYLVIIFQVIFLILTYVGEMQQYDIPYFNGGSDDLTYELEASKIEELNIYSVKKAKDMVLGEYHNSPGYPIMLSAIIKLANMIDGYNTLIPRILNIVIFVISLLFIEDISIKEIKFDKKYRKLLICLLGTTPLLAYINAHVFRDTLLMFLAVVFIWSIFQIRRYSGKINYLFICSISLVLISMLRFPMIPYLLALVPMIYFRKGKSKVIAILCLLTLTFLLKPEIFVNLTSYYNNYYDVYNELIIEGNSSGLSAFIFSIPFLPIGFVLRLGYGVLTPFPDINACIRMVYNFNFFDFIKFLLAIGTIIQIYLCVFMINIKTIKNKVFPVFTVFYFAYVFGTFTFRHMMLFYPFMIMLILDSLKGFKKKNIIFIISALTICIVLASSFYIMIKL